MSFTFIDLFCGIGGFRQALENVDGICVFSSDKNKRARETYQANYGDMPAGDITKISAADIPPFDVLCGGFPCQSFSLAGKQRAFGDPRGLMIFEIARIAEYHKPSVLFLENVDNLARHDGGNTLKVILELLKGIGYDVHYQILKASDFGCATIRKRIYFVCFRKDLNINFSFPEPFVSDVAIEDYLDQDVDEHYYIDSPDIVFYKPDITERIKDTYRMGYIRNISQGRRIYSIKGLAPTFVVSSRGPAGGTEAYHIDGRVRRLTINECKRIMGYPEIFIFPVPEARAYEQIGNTVCVPVLKAIAHQIVASGVFESVQNEPCQML
ncbi:DNA (cytosine-5-)-methyltransferase [Enterocloster clostridioformis]|uniref:DNA cytosine methyltransferase n=1 Tax=Bacteroides acidifaciens TaxID=85831 RepID=UPI0009C32513|nr:MULTISPECIES: DNA (cytosine-5-)-methyltransferase [Bacteria]ANU46501.2 DNA (cytosine-5-)-methyltransferase [Lachnoclostridium sp. YL32]NDO31360.1 DNA (cytosine-5-)-methyltransferase [Enterocloster clostridioformis]OXE65214.1 DNA (cytosine-5-)-methyltransferase [Enterocloster clostridioformis]QQQ98785.1 DNA (cytosine-5-)-methyltransferase [Enterocloster clostridioformis]